MQAALPWRRIRRIGFRALVAPLLVVLITAASAGATLLVNALLTNWIPGK
ncbi:hypothetical protein ACFQFC_07235 [Amorphoplanes digitatis]|uniref:Uncharacterized protein n=1 Tax=Actinoplanes digitatis TaxID=1868 RepID=A0A7W7I056_9ACTN|nr:hypothetical protein [Actinoplanes digitatis]MBB4763994.1 hypothetical protein [Actinoplanes digitatis]